jgi:hypothetical protein
LQCVPGPPKIDSGPDADIQLLPPEKLPELKTLPAIQALTRRSVPIALARTCVEA